MKHEGMDTEEILVYNWYMDLRGGFIPSRFEAKVGLLKKPIIFF